MAQVKVLLTLGLDKAILSVLYAPLMTFKIRPRFTMFSRKSVNDSNSLVLARPPRSDYGRKKK